MDYQKQTSIRKLHMYAIREKKPNENSLKICCLNYVNVSFSVKMGYSHSLKLFIHSNGQPPAAMQIRCSTKIHTPQKTVKNPTFKYTLGQQTYST